MNKIFLLVSLLLLTLASCNSDVAKKIKKVTKKEVDLSNPELDQALKISYSLGYKYAESTKELELTSEQQEYMIKGVQKYFKEKNKQTPSDISRYSREVDKIVQEKRKLKFTENSEKGKIFSETIIKENGFLQTKSGLIYKIIKAGTTYPNLIKTPYVQMNYTAHKIDDTIFETTMAGNPRIINQKGLLKAWKEAIKLAGHNSSIEVIAPPSLTYGENGALPRVEPGEYIVYKINFFKTFKKHPNKI
jgi:FKBP-type peptidyl-prolyl cis-trans isomerase